MLAVRVTAPVMFSKIVPVITFTAWSTIPKLRRPAQLKGSHAPYDADQNS